MNDETKVPVTVEGKAGEEKSPAPSAMQLWRPFDSLRREIDRMFDDFAINPFRLRRPAFDLEPFWQPESWVAAPPINLIERDHAFELTADLPGLDEKNVELKLANGVLTISGHKEEEKEEKRQDFRMRERSFGSFQRSLRVPDGVDVDKIEANFKKGVLTVTLPKTPEAQKAVKKIEVKGG